MKWVNNLKIMNRLLLSFTLISVILAAVGYIGWSNMGKINDNVTAMYKENLIPMDQIAEIQSTVLSIRGDMWKAAAVTEPVMQKDALNQIEQKFTAVNEGVIQYSRRDTSAREQELIDRLKPELQEYREVSEQYAGMVKAGASKEDEINYLVNTVSSKRKATEGLLKDLSALHKENADEDNASSDTIYADSSLGIILLTIIAFLISMAMGVFIGRSISIPLSKAVGLAEVIAGGDLSREVSKANLKRHDEIGMLARALEDMIHKLRHLMEQITLSSHETAALSQELSATTQDVSATMQEITASIEEISSGLESISASTEEVNASGEEMAAALTQLANESESGTGISRDIEARAREVSKHSNEANTQAGNLYADIREKLNQAIADAQIIEEISALVDSISGIASQTNLLALNAAIEAARAGEQGRGFAVVADEVRKLAEESSTTARNIKQLTGNVQSAIDNLIGNAHEILQFVNITVIKDYTEMVKLGETYAGDANTFYQLNERITGMSKQVLASVNEVTKAIESVAMTMNDSSKGAMEIAKGSENTSMSIVQVAESSAKLAENAERLNRLVAAFTI